MSCSRTLQATARVNIGLPSLYMMVRGGRYRPTRQKLFDPPTLTPTRERERKHDAERDFFNSIVLGRFCTLTPLRKISFAREHGDQPETWRKLENWSHSRTSSWCRPSTAGAESIITEFIHVCFRFIRSLLCERRTEQLAWNFISRRRLNSRRSHRHFISISFDSPCGTRRGQSPWQMYH